MGIKSSHHLPRQLADRQHVSVPVLLCHLCSRSAASASTVIVMIPVRTDNQPERDCRSGSRVPGTNRRY